jgi:hypothetical protein
MDPRCTEACQEIFLHRAYRIADLSDSIFLEDRPRVQLAAAERDQLIDAIRSDLR